MSDTEGAFPPYAPHGCVCAHDGDTYHQVCMNHACRPTARVKGDPVEGDGDGMYRPKTTTGHES